MSEKNEYRAYFALTGEFDPSAISASLGIQPTRQWRKGDHNARSGKAYIFSRWELESRLNRTEEVAKHIEDVLVQLMPVSKVVKRLSSEHEGYIQCVAYFMVGQSSLDIDAGAVQEISTLGLGINFDPYDLRSSNEENA